jgi:hypothetical protein
MTNEFHENARRLRNAVEPVAGGCTSRRASGPHFGSGLTIDTAAELYGNKGMNRVDRGTARP